MYSEFSVGIFPLLTICGMLELPVSPKITKVNNQYTDSYPAQPFSLSPSVRYPVNDMKYATLSYKTGFVLDDSAQL